MGKQYQWSIKSIDKFHKSQKVEYINDCCQFCDQILFKIKDDLRKKLNLEEENIEIGQEDWGWYLSLQMDETFYELNISYEDFEDNHYQFCVVLEAKRMKKFFFFYMTNKALPEKLTGFDKIIKEIAELNHIKISES